MDNTITLYQWILNQFTVSARSKGLLIMEPYLNGLINTRDQVLDLCCGTGLMSFWFEERGAEVTAVDFAPYMLELARQEARRRNAKVQFIEADIFDIDLGVERYDLVSCFGNSISDFPIANFQRLVKKVFAVLKQGGKFAIQYHDGSYAYMQGKASREGVYQEEPERVTYRIKEYLPEIGAYVNTIHNETRGEFYERRGFIYTVPVVRLIAESLLALDQHIVMEENHYLDIYHKPKVQDSAA